MKLTSQNSNRVMLRICSWCKWLGGFVPAQAFGFTHGICPCCKRKHWGL